MLKRTIVSSTLVASLLLVGCGGGGSESTTSSTPSTGTGYYVDSAVKGIDYVCGSKSGVTGEDGSFTFEVNQKCTFKIGNLVLREVNASILENGLTILEDHPDVARLLQTLDRDGNASNGIEIPELAKSLELDEIPTEDALLATIHDELAAKDEHYSGRVVSVEESQSHLRETHEDIKSRGKKTQYDTIESSKTVAYFGDKENNVIVVVDVDSMSLIKKIATGHEVTYAAERILVNYGDRMKLYVDNRGSNAIDVIDEDTNQIVKTIPLEFYPRSIDVNSQTGFAVVSGANKTMASVIDTATDQVLVTVGEDNLTASTGHPKWLNSNHFALLDRENQRILTYKITQDSLGNWEGSLVNTLETSSPIHNLIPPEVHGQHGRLHGTETSTIFFATAEGTDSVYGAVLKLEFLEGVGLSQLESLDIVPVDNGLTAEDTGVHHHNFLADQKTIYVGSKEGTLYVVDYATSPMQIVKRVQAGKGAGHTAELKSQNIAVVINHTDRFITLMNTLTNEKIADINVSNVPDEEIGIVQTQSHPEYYFSEDGRYFYLFLTQEGALVKVDLTAKQVAQRLEIGGKISMGSFVTSSLLDEHEEEQLEHLH